jgi:hypothetical protein
MDTSLYLLVSEDANDEVRGMVTAHQILAFALRLYLWGPAIAKVSSQTQEQSPLRKVVDIPLPGKAVRFDYKSLDATHGRLYIAHMNADQLVVFDIKKHEVVTNLDGFLRVHGVWAVPEIGRVYASATGERQVAVVDMQSAALFSKGRRYQDVAGTWLAPRVFSLENIDGRPLLRIMAPTTTN